MPKKRVQHGFTIEDLKAIMDSMTANDQVKFKLILQFFWTQFKHRNFFVRQVSYHFKA